MLRTLLTGALDILHNLICLKKLRFFADLNPNFLAICLHMISTFGFKSAQKSSIFSSKAGYVSCLLLFLIPFMLQGEPKEYEEPGEVATTEGVPSSLVNQSVSAITGEYTQTVQDIALLGPETLIIERTYGSFSNAHFGHSWSLNHGESAILGDAVYDNNTSSRMPIWIIALKQPSGTQLDYIHPISKEAKKKKRLKFNLLVPKGLTNGSSQISGKTNLKNQEIHYYSEEDKVVAISGAGDKRTFVKTGRTDDGWAICNAEKEEKANGSIYEYKFKEKNKEWDRKIVCKSRAELQYSNIKFLKSKKSDEQTPLIFAASDGSELKYYFKKHHYKEKEGDWKQSATRSASESYLIKVDRPYAPLERYEYEKKACSKSMQMTLRKGENGRFQQIEYYQNGKNAVGGKVGIVEINDKDDYRLDRVKKLKAPVGTDKKGITTHRFAYKCKVKKSKETGRRKLGEGTTDVYDALDHRTQYVYDEQHRLIEIIRYGGDSSDSNYSSENFLWDDEGNLIGKNLKGENGKPHHARIFTYDNSGNVLISTLYGKLTGRPSPSLSLHTSGQIRENGCECEKKQCTYSDDGLNLLLSETSGEKTIQYRYIPKTSRLQAIYTLSGNEIQLREFYAYDAHYALIEKIRDDGKGLDLGDMTGVTERIIATITPRRKAPFGLPEEVEESYIENGAKKKLRTTKSHYSTRGELLKQEIFDANDNFAYALKWEYDKHGNVISETNALGKKTLKTYDENDNLITESFLKEHSLESHYTIKNTYDYVNRLICKEEKHSDRQQISTTYRYDYLGNCIASIDPYGHETTYTFDSFNRPITIQAPAVLYEGELIAPLLSTEYDIAGNPTKTTDAKGNVTLSEYNIRKQPTFRVYPDGSTERWFYQLDGALAEKIAKNGTSTHYARDFLGRVREETVISKEGELLKKTEHSYNAWHLLRTTDPEGLETHFTYDKAGRLERKQTGNKEERYFYDSLGRVSEIREWFGTDDEYRSTIKEYDLLDRIIEERIQTSTDIILNLLRYAYDRLGNRTLTQNGEIKTWTEFDSCKRAIKLTNEKGETTHIVYNMEWKNGEGQRVLQTTTTDPLGYCIIETYDPLNRLVDVRKENPFGGTVSHIQKSYDLAGNLSSEKTLQTGNQYIETRYQYSEVNQRTACIEAPGTIEQKITRIHYNAYGEKKEVIKPDGSQLYFEYDSLGRMKHLSSSDGSIAYHYKYDKHDLITEVTDLNGEVTEKKYNPMGELEEERLSNGLTLKYAYDRMGRVNKMTIPDHTSVEYTYDALNLKEVRRIIDSRCVYSHLNVDHAIEGLLKKVMFSNGNHGEYHYDRLGRCIKIDTPFFQQTIPLDGYDAGGHLLRFEMNGAPYQFDYDDHDQIRSEKGHVSHNYQFDALANRTLRDEEPSHHNTLNQLIRKGEELFSYDANGNLICRTLRGKKTKYAYDALDRLVSVTEEGNKIKYHYDSLHRRLKKIINGKQEYYLYQGQEEIGRFVDGACAELRILGKDRQVSTIAIEIDREVYVPIHDLFCNITALTDLKGSIVEKYRYSSFGEREIFNPQGDSLNSSAIGNPWQYASKRYDEDSRLVAFGLRDYDPSLGRWMTPDPAGSIDGANLYAYVHNDPLRYHDQLGLWSLEGAASFIFPSSEASTPVIMVDKEKNYTTGLSMDFHFDRTIEDPTSSGYYQEVPSIYHFTSLPTSGALLRQTAGITYGLVNGISTDLHGLRENLIHAASLANHAFTAVHSPSYGFNVDVFRYLDARKGIATETVQKIHESWNNAFAEYPNGYICWSAHSRGVADTLNALKSYPEHLRKRIEVIAIAPAAFIDEYLCGKVTHLVSVGDKIPRLDPEGMTRCSNTIHYLPAAEGLWLNSHSMTNEIYNEPLTELYQNFYKRHTK